MQINSILKEFQASPVRQIFFEAVQIPNSISLSIGEPDILPDEELLNKTLEFAKHNPLPYAPSGGGTKIKTLIANYYNNKYQGNYTSENIVATVGVSEALSSLFHTILNPNDEVIIPAPYFPGYPNYVLQAYGKVITAQADPSNNFVVTPELIEKYRTPNTKAILFSNPSNPTGTVMTKEQVETLVAYIKTTDLTLIVDEIYSEISFVPFTSFAGYSEIASQCIILNGFSKSFSMTGWRLGYIIAPKEVCPHLTNAHLYTVTAPTTLSLKMGEIALEEFSDRSHVCALFKERAEYVYSALKELGFSPLPSQGSLYLFTSYENISDLNSLDFSMDLLRKTGVATVPGIGFGMESWIRIALTQDLSTLKEAITRIQHYTKKP